MRAISRATARDTRTWAPKKLIFTASAFWIMKTTSTISARTLTIKAVRALLIEVRSRRRRTGAAAAAVGGGAVGGGAEPLADGGGSVPAVPA